MKRYIVLLIFSSLILAVFFLNSGEYITVRKFESPDGKYFVQVCKKKELFSMPGDSFGGSGIVVLKSSDDKIIKRKKCDMISLIDDVRWSDGEVDIKLFVSWSLPELK